MTFKYVMKTLKINRFMRKKIKTKTLMLKKIQKLYYETLNKNYFTRKEIKTKIDWQLKKHMSCVEHHLKIEYKIQSNCENSCLLICYNSY